MTSLVLYLLEKSGLYARVSLDICQGQSFLMTGSLVDKIAGQSPYL